MEMGELTVRIGVVERGYYKMDQKLCLYLSWIIATFICFSGDIKVCAVEPYPLVKGEGYCGVIFPKNYSFPPELFIGLRAENRWTPTDVDIAKAEKAIATVLNKAKDDPSIIQPFVRESPEHAEYVKREVNQIIRKLPNYHRQYFGLIVEGKKKILCNFFPSSLGDIKEPFPDWRSDYIEVNDGGSGFWRITYDLESNTCSQFGVNGYA